jgi:methylmalonyl-CoA/ethylmalonyl-CoA epimerase
MLPYIILRRYKMLKKIDHIGLVVKDMEKAVKFYTEIFGFKVLEKNEGRDGELILAMLAIGDIKLEIFQPIKPSSYMSFLEEHGGGVHHISFETDDIVGDTKKLKASGKKLQTEELLTFGDLLIAFIDPSDADNVLIELIEKIT